MCIVKVCASMFKLCKYVQVCVSMCNYVQIMCKYVQNRVVHQSTIYLIPPSVPSSMSVATYSYLTEVYYSIIGMILKYVQILHCKPSNIGSDLRKVIFIVQTVRSPLHVCRPPFLCHSSIPCSLPTGCFFNCFRP